MSKTNKCDAEVCFGAARTRCPLVRCEFCTISVHTKCVNISSTMHKLLRESPGICWLCVKCRDPESRKNSSRDTTRLILQRTTSSLKLIGALVESMNLFCRMYTRSGPSNNPAQPQADRSLSELFQDAPNFTDLFASIIGDERQRTSSVSRPSSSPADKSMEVNVPITNDPGTSTIVSSISGAINDSGVPVNVSDSAALAAVIAVTEHAAADALEQPANIASSPTAALVATAERAATLAVEQANARAVKQAAAHAAQLKTAHAAVAAAESATSKVAKQAAEKIAALASAHAIELAAARAASAATHTSVPAATAYLNTEQAAAGGNECATALINAHTSAQTAVPTAVPTARRTDTISQLTTQPIVLAVADATAAAQPITPVERNWLYITRFMPNETTANIVSYIQSKTDCDPSKIICQKLVRQGNASRPLSFVSFKICVPKEFETNVIAADFWPPGVTVKPFLVERTRPALPARSRPRTVPRGPPPKTTGVKRTTPKQLLVPDQINSTSAPRALDPMTQAAVLPPSLPPYHQLPFLPMYSHYQHPVQPALLYSQGLPQM